MQTSTNWQFAQDKAVGPMSKSARQLGAVARARHSRAAALVVAAFAADGESRIYGIHHLARGYAELAGQLQTLGAEVEQRGRVDTLTN